MEEKKSEPPATKLTPELEHASIQGSKMMKAVFFPALPALLQDLWVYAELGISLFAFTFGLVDLFPIEENAAFQIVYLVLTIISIILALVDANVYFFQLGSCARAYRTFRIYLANRKNKTSSQIDQADPEKAKYDLEIANKTEEDDDEEKLPWYRLSTKWKERLSTWFDLIRTIASELLLYPLVIFDLFDFVAGGGYQPENADDRVNFTLFVVGGFYLILAVYIMRIFMVAGALSSLLKIPLVKRQNSGDGGNHIDMIVKFCIHLIGQIAVHLMILVVIGAKIADENIYLIEGNASDISGSGLNSQSNTIRASAFLAVAIILGSVIPLIGIIMFFAANYYWMQEFSIVLWVDMVSLLQGQGFAETVFGGEGTAPSKEMAQSFADNTSFSTVKKQLRRFKSPPFYQKFLHPARVPLAGISCFIYGATLVIFIVFLALTTDENGNVSVTVFKNDNVFTTTFIITTLCITIANIHVLVLFSIEVVVLLLISIIALPTIILLIFVVIFIYIPLLSYYGVRKIISDRQSSRNGDAFEVGAKDNQVYIEMDSISKDSGNNSSKTKSLEQAMPAA